MFKKLIAIIAVLASIPHSVLADSVPENAPEFVILICSYKNEKWAYNNLKSACHQASTKPYHVICVNDCSPDNTGAIMDEYVKAHKLESKVTVIHNKERCGALANIYNAVHSVADHKIIVSLDGDDTLAHNNVLLRLEQEYKDPDIWLTYGSFTPRLWPDSYEMTEKIVRKYEIRKKGKYMSALRTFKAGLFKKIKKEDLMYEGKFFPVAQDTAIIIPMLEMASPLKPHSKIRFKKIWDILYNYNTHNPISDHRVSAQLQNFFDKHIRSLKPYKPLKNL